MWSLIEVDQAAHGAQVAQAKHQSTLSVDARQSLVGSLRHASQVSPIMVAYAVMVPYPGASTPLPTASNSHEKE